MDILHVTPDGSLRSHKVKQIREQLFNFLKQGSYKGLLIDGSKIRFGNLHGLAEFLGLMDEVHTLYPSLLTAYCHLPPDILAVFSLADIGSDWIIMPNHQSAIAWMNSQLSLIV
jgi:anti-anti-sigma regulatory factor